jgi:hypothetical protein
MTARIDFETSSAHLFIRSTMSTVRQPSRQHLTVSAYDRVSSWLVSLLIIACVTVGSLLIIYFTHKFILTDFSAPVMPVASGGGGTGGIGGAPGGDDLSPPGVEDAQTTNEQPIQDTLSAVATAVSNRTAMLADDQIDVGMDPSQGKGDNRTPGFGGGRGGGVGGGIGSGFGPGHGGPAEPRREIRFEPASLLEYAQWLDYFQIELGVLSPQDNKVYYAYHLSNEKPDVKIGDPAQEQRLFMNPTDSQFAALDRQLCVKAGIATKGPIILQFYPPKAFAILYGLEKQRANPRKRETIRGTVFRVKHNGNTFEFSVEDQTYR